MALDLALPGVIGDFTKAEEQARNALRNTKGANERVVQGVVLQAVRQTILSQVFEKVSDEVENLYQSYALINGDRPADSATWDSDLDDEVMRNILTGDIETLMGPGYCGERSVDTRLHDDKERATFIRTLAQDIAAELVTKEKDQIIGYFDLKAIAEPHEPVKAPSGSNFKPAVVGLLRETLAMGLYSDEEVLSDIDLASDSEEALAVGALQRMGASEANAGILRAAFLDWKALDPKFAIEAMDLAKGYEAVKPKRTRKKTVAAEPVVAATQDVGLDDLLGETPPMTAIEAENRTVTIESVRGGSMEVEPAALGGKAAAALQLLAKHGPYSQRDLAEKLGLKRGTLNNIVDGKAPFEPTAEQIEWLRTMTEEHSRALIEAYGNLT